MHHYNLVVLLKIMQTIEKLLFLPQFRKEKREKGVFQLQKLSINYSGKERTCIFFNIHKL